MMTLEFRPAQATDVEATVPLIYSSGPKAFEYVFGHHSKGDAQTFLRYAFQDGAGEFGCRNHIVGVMDGEIVCAGAGFTGETGLGFTLTAIRQIFTHYGVFHAWNVIRKGLLLERVIQPPRKEMYCVAHLGVRTDLQGQGIGTKLIEHLLLPQYLNGRTTICLDVAGTNPRAQALYERMGFRVTKVHESNLKSQFGEVGKHHRMEKVLE